MNKWVFKLSFMVSVHFQLNLNIDSSYGSNLFSLVKEKLSSASVSSFELPYGFSNSTINLNILSYRKF